MGDTCLCLWHFTVVYRLTCENLAIFGSFTQLCSFLLYNLASLSGSRYVLDLCTWYCDLNDSIAHTAYTVCTHYSQWELVTACRQGGMMGGCTMAESWNCSTVSPTYILTHTHTGTMLITVYVRTFPLIQWCTALLSMLGLQLIVCTSILLCLAYNDPLI